MRRPTLEAGQVRITTGLRLKKRSGVKKWMMSFYTILFLRTWQFRGDFNTILGRTDSGIFKCCTNEFMIGEVEIPMCTDHWSIFE